MKIFALILFFLTIAFFYYSGFSSWHLDRNKHNVLPSSNLELFSENKYKDSKGRIWELQPHLKNVLHQPSEMIKSIEKPYPNIVNPPKLDLENPNLKFLSEDGTGGSYEVIVQANGEYLLKGSKRGTYNYANPEGFWGMIKHTVLDVIPHFINGNYRK